MRGKFPFTPRSAVRNFSPGCEGNPHGWLRAPESKFLKTKTRAATPERRTPSENCGFNANSRERSLSAFCVNWSEDLLIASLFDRPVNNARGWDGS